MVCNSSSSSISNSTINICETTAAYISDGLISVRFLLLVPLCSYIIYLGWLQWRRQSSFRSSSHSDIFTYNVAVLELLCASGTIVYVFWKTFNLQGFMITVCQVLFVLNFNGEAFFHILSCVERYLAVVHPIIYMRLRSACGVLIRNLSIAFVWLIALVLSYVAVSEGFTPVRFLLGVSAISLVIVSFCSFSVLCVLIRPGPGEGGGNKGGGDQMKQRAFFTITVIMVVLFIWFFGFLMTNLLSSGDILREDVSCVVRFIGLWFNLPSSLVSPVLYLHRIGKGSTSCRCRWGTGSGTLG